MGLGSRGRQQRLERVVGFGVQSIAGCTLNAATAPAHRKLSENFHLDTTATFLTQRWCQLFQLAYKGSAQLHPISFRKPKFTEANQDLLKV